jgi:hypothetical protein
MPDADRLVHAVPVAAAIGEDSTVHKLRVKGRKSMLRAL